MPDLNIRDLRRALIQAGVDIFRVRGDEIHIAERQNVQLMEAGIRASAGSNPVVHIVVRAQRTDGPSNPPDYFFNLVRERSSQLAEHGYKEVEANAREIRNVSDESHILDVWYEVTFVRPVESIEQSVQEVQRALTVERYVQPSAR